MHPITHPSNHTSVHSPTHPFTHPSIHPSYIHSPYPLIHLIHSPTHPFIHTSTVPPTHPSIHPSIHLPHSHRLLLLFLHLPLLHLLLYPSSYIHPSSSVPFRSCSSHSSSQPFQPPVLPPICKRTPFI